MNEVVRNAVDVPRNADRINKTENQHDPEWDAREKIKHPKEVDTMQNGCRDRDDVPAGVGKNPGICLRTLYRDRFTRRSWHCVRNPCWNTQFSRINPVGNSRSDLEPFQKPLHCAKGQPNRGKKFLVVEWLGEKSRRASFQRSGTNERIVFSSKHDDARRRRKLPQSRL